LGVILYQREVLMNSAPNTTSSANQLNHTSQSSIQGLVEESTVAAIARALEHQAKAIESLAKVMEGVGNKLDTRLDELSSSIYRINR
jgi:hypothetical protein